jgi:PEP-CTERM motif
MGQFDQSTKLGADEATVFAVGCLVSCCGLGEKMRARNTLLALAIAVWAGHSAFASVLMPVALTSDSFNENIVAGSGSDPNASTTGAGVTATVDKGTDLSTAGQATYYLLGYNNNTINPGHGAPSTGVPLGTTITSLDMHFDGSSYSPAGLPSADYTFQSATATDNVLYIDSEQGPTSATMTFVTPAAYKSLSFLAESGSNALQYVVNYVNGSHSAPAPIVIPGWFNPGDVAFQPDGRVFNSAGGPPFNSFDNGQTGNPNGSQIYEYDSTLVDQTDPIASITVSLGASPNNARSFIFAVSGEAVPEPTSLGLLVISAAGLLRRRRMA